jgi:hypothetical protein
MRFGMDRTPIRAVGPPQLSRHPSNRSPGEAMKHLITVLALAVTAAATSAYAADAPAKEPTKQQTKMATCNKDATGMKGDERKAFMKTCLSAKKETQQDKMKMCNADAAGKKGDERKAFMKECLSK